VEQLLNHRYLGVSTSETLHSMPISKPHCRQRSTCARPIGRTFHVPTLLAEQGEHRRLNHQRQLLQVPQPQGPIGGHDQQPPCAICAHERRTGAQVQGWQQPPARWREYLLVQCSEVKANMQRASA